AALPGGPSPDAHSATRTLDVPLSTTATAGPTVPRPLRSGGLAVALGATAIAIPIAISWPMLRSGARASAAPPIESLAAPQLAAPALVSAKPPLIALSPSASVAAETSRRPPAAASPVHGLSRTPAGPRYNPRDHL